MDLRYNKLEKQNKILQEKYQKVVLNLNSQKSINQKLQKQISRVRLTLEKIAQQKNELSSLLQQSKEYSKKLQIKFTLGKKPQELSYIRQISKLHSQIQSLQQISAKKQDQIEKLRDHISILTQALQIKASQLEYEGEPGLLYDVGQSRSELQKARQGNQDYKQVVSDLKQRLDQAYGLIQQLQMIRESNNQDLNSLETENLKLRDQTQKQKKQISNLTEERLDLLDYVDQLTKANSSNAFFLEELNKKGIKSPKSFKNYLSKAQKTINSNEDLQIQLDQGNKVINDQQKRIRKLQRNLNDLLDEHSQIQERQQHQKEVYQNSSLNLIELKKENKVKDQQINELMRENSQFRQEMKEIKSNLKIYQQKLKIIQTDTLKSEEMLKMNMEKAYGDLQEIAEQRDQLRQAMNEAISKCANSLLQQKQLEKEYTNMKKQVEKLTHSKGLLQQTMVDQVNALKSRNEDLQFSLDQVEAENLQLRQEYQALKNVGRRGN